MITIKSTTKRGSSFVESYNRSNNYSLRDCYGRYSWNKEKAENDCRRWMIEGNGSGFKIISFNTMQFTCGWRVPGGLRVETASNSYLITD